MLILDLMGYDLSDQSHKYNELFYPFPIRGFHIMSPKQLPLYYGESNS